MKELPGHDVTAVVRIWPDSGPVRLLEAVGTETGLDLLGHLAPEVALK